LFRNLMTMFGRYAKTEAEKKKIFETNTPAIKELKKRAVSDLIEDPVEGPKVAGLIKINAEKGKAELKKRVLRRAAGLVTADGFSVQTTAEVKVTGELKAKEKRRQQMPGFLGLELRRRPPVEADYALPELFRAYFRVASQKAPHLVDRMLAEIERVTDMTPVPLKMDDGTEEIALVRRTVSPNWWLSRPAIRGYLNRLHELRPQIAQLKEIEDRDSVKDVLEPLEKRYDVALEHLQEFERTNSTLRMMFSSPLAQVGRAIIKHRAKIDRDQQKVLDQCAVRLASY
jgi:hypothetical protein